MAGILGVTRSLPRNLIKIGASNLKNLPQVCKRIFRGVLEKIF